MYYFKKISRMVFGLFVFGFGMYLTVQANIGLAPWETFAQGISKVTSLSFGNSVVLTSGLVLVIVLLMRERIGLGTILNSILIGKFVDLFQWIGIVPQIKNFWVGVVVLLCGQFLVSVGSYYYISSGMCCGPRDALMVSLNKRFPKLPVGVVRGTIEAVVLFLGWLLGGKVGVGTVIAVFGISFIMQFVFHLFKFDVKTVVHEDIITTFRNIFSKKSEQ